MARKSVNKMDDQAPEQAIQTTEAQLTGLQARVEKLQSQCMTLYDRLKALKEERAERLVAAAQQQGGYPWEELLKFEYTEPNYQMLQRAMAAIEPEGTIAQSGYNPETMQYVLRFYMTDRSAKRLDQVKANFAMLLPYIKPHPETGERFVDFMEPSLSQYESYHLYEKDGKWSIRTSRYSRTREVATFNSANEMIDYLQANYNMDHSSDDHDDDNDY